MIESLLEEITRLPNEEADKPNSSAPTEANNSLIAALPIVQTIVNRKISSSWQADASDLMQGITLKLLKWREKYTEKSNEMSNKDWESFAARTAYNEINRFFTTNKSALKVPIEEAIPVVTQKSAKGNTRLEFSSLANHFWQKICCLSLRQRRALLLNSYELVFYLVKSGVKDEELQEALNLSPDDWEKVKTDLPLTDAKIAELLKKTGKKGSLESMTKSIKKGRHEARKKLRRLMD